MKSLLVITDNGLLGSSDIQILSDEEVFGLPAEAVTQNPEPRNASPSPTDEIFDSDEEVFQPVEVKSKISAPSEKIQSCQSVPQVLIVHPSDIN